MHNAATQVKTCIKPYELGLLQKLHNSHDALFDQQHSSDLSS